MNGRILSSVRRGRGASERGREGDRDSEEWVERDERDEDSGESGSERASRASWANRTSSLPLLSWFAREERSYTLRVWAQGRQARMRLAHSLRSREMREREREICHFRECREQIHLIYTRIAAVVAYPLPQIQSSTKPSWISFTSTFTFIHLADAFIQSD